MKLYACLPGALLIALAACDDGASGGADEPDIRLRMTFPDRYQAIDAPAPGDAGPLDSGASDAAGRDASGPADATGNRDAQVLADGAGPGVDALATDSASATPDRQIPSEDAMLAADQAAVPADTAPPLPDGPLPANCEAPPAGDLLPNGGFEAWTGDHPDGWGGEQTNLAPESVSREEAHPRCGLAALRLERADDSHRRFTVAVPEVRAGRHTLVYWVRGHGEIRTAWYGIDFSNYEPYREVDDETWARVTWEFNVAEDVPSGFEVIFSVRNTEADLGHLQVDDVSLVRAPGLCDAVVCEEWAACDRGSGVCEPLFDRCADDDGCVEWEACGADHRCAPRAGRCAAPEDCAATPATPRCDVPAHTCVAGDACADVECQAWQVCEAGRCILPPGGCRTSADCLDGPPACDSATFTCVAADAAANRVPNGGFEGWAVRDIPFHGDNLVPDAWYGLAEPGETEIDPDDVVRTDGGHGGLHALQLVNPGIPADRFASEPFRLPAGPLTCGYWVRGHGEIAHRWFSSGGWSPQFDRLPVDTDTWTPVHFDVPGNLQNFRLIFYASNTLADRGHIQIDDVICTPDR